MTSMMNAHIIYNYFKQFYIKKKTDTVTEIKVNSL